MKKILGIIIMACLLMTMVPFASFAADGDPVLTIKAYNITFKDSVYLKYAVSAENADDVRMLIWTEDQDTYEYGTQAFVLESDGTTTVSGVRCKTFTFTNLTAKQMTDNVYGRAYTVKNGQTYYSKVTKYSILDYAYNKMGKTGTATTDAKLLNLIDKMLEYGAAAQIYYNGGTGYHLERLANDTYYQVKVVGGTLQNGFDKQLYKPMTYVTIKAPAEDENGVAFDHWEDSEGEYIGSDAEMTIIVGAENEVYTAKYTAFADSFTVTFKDFDGTVLSSQSVAPGRDATAPETPERTGYTFAKWSGSYQNVTSDRTVTAVYYEGAGCAFIVGDAYTSADGMGIAIPIYANINSGITTARIKLDFGANLSLTSVTPGASFSSLIGAQNYPVSNSVVLNWTNGTTNITGDCIFATLYFDNVGLTFGSASITLTYDEDDVCNTNYDNVPFEVVNGTIFVD